MTSLLASMSKLSATMYTGATRGRRPHLTAAQKQYRRDWGLCAYCGEPGHAVDAHNLPHHSTATNQACLQMTLPVHRRSTAGLIVQPESINAGPPQVFNILLDPNYQSQPVSGELKALVLLAKAVKTNALFVNDVPAASSPEGLANVLFAAISHLQNKGDMPEDFMPLSLSPPVHQHDHKSGQIQTYGRPPFQMLDVSKVQCNPYGS